MIPHDRLPMWLAGINDNKVKPEAQPWLLQAQLHIRQVLGRPPWSFYASAQKDGYICHSCLTTKYMLHSVVLWLRMLAMRTENAVRSAPRRETDLGRKPSKNPKQVHLGIRVDEQTDQQLQDEVDRIHQQHPGLAISKSDVVRMLIAEAFASRARVKK